MRSDCMRSIFSPPNKKLNAKVTIQTFENGHKVHEVKKHNSIQQAGQDFLKDEIMVDLSAGLTTSLRHQSRVSSYLIRGLVLTKYNGEKDPIKDARVLGAVNGYAILDSTYSGSDSLRGTINDAESSVSSKLLKIVVDFPTNTANAEIGSVYLVQAPSSSSSSYALPTLPTGREIVIARIGDADETTYRYCFDITTNKIYVQYWTAGLVECNLIDGTRRTIKSREQFSAIGAANGNSMSFYEGHIYILNSVASNSGPVIKINVSTGDVEYLPLPGVPSVLPGSMYESGVFCRDGKIHITYNTTTSSTTAERVYKVFDLTTLEEISSEIISAPGTGFNTGTTSYNFGVDEAGGIYFAASSHLIYGYKHNGEWFINRSYGINGGSDGGFIHSGYLYSFYSRTEVRRSYVNNAVTRVKLDEPITKLPTQVMKVIYEIEVTTGLD